MQPTAHIRFIDDGVEIRPSEQHPIG